MMAKLDNATGLPGIDAAYGAAAYGGGAEATVVPLTGPVTIIVGTNGSDSIIGGDGTDILYGLGGNDLLSGGLGADTLIGGTGNDTYVVDNTGDMVVEEADEGSDTVQSSVSYTLSENVEVLTLTGTANLNGGASDTGGTLNGNSGNNVLTGGAGSDALLGYAGNDTLLGGAGDDALDGGLGDDILQGGTGNDVLLGETGNDVLDGGAGNDKLSGGPGDDTYVIDSSGDSITEMAGDGTDTVQSAVSYTLGANLENLTLTGSANINGTGTTGNNILTGNDGINTLVGGGGSDKLYGGAGNDTLISGAGNDVLDGGSGSDAMSGGDGNDTYYANTGGDWISEAASGGTDWVFSSTSYTLPANVEVLQLTGAAFRGTANDGGAKVFGTAGTNLLVGGLGGDLLDGGAGVDTMQGGQGDDSYYVDNPQDVVIEKAGEGTDTVFSSITYSLAPTDSPAPTTADVENLTLTGTGNLNGTGNALDNVLVGNTGNNTLNGGGGNDWLDGKGGVDSLIGGAGNDTFIVNAAGNTTISENAGEGTDTVISAANFTLAANLENLILTGTANLSGTGNSGNNVITGNSGNNVLSGGAGGTDVLVGGGGDDTYIIDATATAVTVSEAAGGGTDTVKTAISLTLPANVENLVFTGTGGGTITGNELSNILIGGDGNDTLSGGSNTAKSNCLNGGKGNDTYIVGNAGDTVTELAGGGTADVVQSSVNYALPANVENLTLTGTANLSATGNELNNILTGNAGDNILDGGLGADAMIGGLGNDIFIVDNVGDTVTELAAQGSDDCVHSSVTYTLPPNVECLELQGTANIDGSGQAEDNEIYGNSGNNVLYGGGGGIDVLVGGLGNDTYIIDTDTATIVENENTSDSPSEGIDWVKSSISFALPLNVENLALTGSAAIDATGNAGNNIILGNNAANTLDGGGGNDSLSGGGGNDTYLIDNTGTTVTESASAGVDLVLSSINYSLPANVENLTLTEAGLAANGTGNALNNLINGNSAANLIDGGVGADWMIGGDGNDTYIIDNNSTVAALTGTAADGSSLSATITGDTLLETATGGIDWAQSSVSYALPANVENLVLTGTLATNGSGNGLNNYLLGNATNNVLDGKAGADLMVGGLGNDTYYVDDLTTAASVNGQGIVGDTISEAANGGIDTVASTLSYTLGANLENLILQGAANINGIGNSLNNAITGNAANNLIDGGGGADIMSGGSGNDTYLVDNGGDQVIESASGGMDSVQSSVNYALPANVENLTLTGANAVNGSGNADNNIITGNGAANVLNGGAGNDRLAGGGGVDILTGGAGNDTFAYANQADSGLGSGKRDVIADFVSGQDKIDLSGLDADPSTGALEHWVFVTAFSASGVGEIKFTAATASAPALVQFDYGDGTADFQIELTQVGATPQALTAADFIL